MSKVKLVCTLPWRENVHKNKRFIGIMPFETIRIMTDIDITDTELQTAREMLADRVSIKKIMRYASLNETQIPVIEQ